jgi:hypothetical protein
MFVPASLFINLRNRQQGVYVVMAKRAKAKVTENFHQHFR